ncbi:hypothetical protein Gogos_009255, partial [Gossypium gossypioides]|nr:hypothetical protein [Gossypium gossypioides]
CILISLFLTIFVYLRLLTSESRIRNYLRLPVTIQRLPEIVDDRAVLSVQVLEKLLPSLKIYEDNKHQLKYSDCPICLDDYMVGESFTAFPQNRFLAAFIAVLEPKTPQKLYISGASMKTLQKVRAIAAFMTKMPQKFK